MEYIQVLLFYPALYSISLTSKNFLCPKLLDYILPQPITRQEWWEILPLWLQNRVVLKFSSSM